MKNTTSAVKANKTVMVLLILGLSTIIFPLYMTIIIAFKQPSEMTNSISGLLSLPKTWSLNNFREAMEVTDFWRSFKPWELSEPAGSSGKRSLISTFPGIRRKRSIRQSPGI